MQQGKTTQPQFNRRNRRVFYQIEQHPRHFAGEYFTGGFFMKTKIEKISNRDIDITIHPVDGFTLSYRDSKGRYFKQRYIFYGKREAMRRFKKYVYEEAKK